jgi:hypothetical protein
VVGDFAYVLKGGFLHEEPSVDCQLILLVAGDFCSAGGVMLVVVFLLEHGSFVLGAGLEDGLEDAGLGGGECELRQLHRWIDDIIN